MARHNSDPRYPHLPAKTDAAEQQRELTKAGEIVLEWLRTHGEPVCDGRTFWNALEAHGVEFALLQQTIPHLAQAGDIFVYPGPGGGTWIRLADQPQEPQRKQRPPARSAPPPRQSAEMTAGELVPGPPTVVDEPPSPMGTGGWSPFNFLLNARRWLR